MNQLPELTDEEIVSFYEIWSEMFHASGFFPLPLDEEILPKSFLFFVRARLLEMKDGFTDYEQDLIDRWRKLEQNSKEK